MDNKYRGTYVHFHSSGFIELSAQKETDKRTLYIDSSIPLDIARRIQLTLNFADKYDIPLGHANWHIENNVPYAGCWSCKNIKTEQRKRTRRKESE